MQNGNGGVSTGVLVAIAGASCSGKTTISTGVASALGAVLLHLDQYWIDEAPRPTVNGYQSREQPHQYDGEALMRKADILLAQGHTVVAEGFLVLCYPEIVARADHSFFISAPHEILAARRAARTTSGGNVVWVNRGNEESRVDAGWHMHGREEWERWGAPQGLLPGVIQLDGTRPVEESVALVVQKVELGEQ